MPREVTRFAGSSASLIRAVTGRLSARGVPVNVWMPRSLASWASRRRSSLARPTSRQLGVTAMAASAGEQADANHGPKHGLQELAPVAQPRIARGMRRPNFGSSR